TSFLILTQILNLMKIFPLACESLGTRSFAHIVQTESLTVLIDPSVSLAPYRFSLPPHPIELAVARQSRKIILKAISKVDIIIQTHYHADHYTLGVPRKYEFTNKQTFEAIYNQGKKILAKDPESKLSYRQRRRAYWLWKRDEIDIIKADGRSFDFGETTITFSPPVTHGLDEKRGCVLEVLISDENTKYLFTSDVSGPASKEATEFILENNPDLVVVDGIAYYHPQVSEEEKNIAFANLKRIVDEIKDIYIDHHFLRFLDWKMVLKEKIGKILPAFSEINNQKPFLLEAKRKQLHSDYPVEKEFYSEFDLGIYSREYFDLLLRDFEYNRYWENLIEQLK
ncbi:MAG: MBL fold metallo-hydrolase, partial [Candidatus Heimdallarchaeaceae archaeon]